jgi:hypothetical protein
VILVEEYQLNARELAEDAGKNRGCCYAVLIVQGRGFYTPGEGFTNKAFAQFQHLRPGQRVAIYWEDELCHTYYVGKLVREDECPAA